MNNSEINALALKAKHGDEAAFLRLKSLFNKRKRVFDHTGLNTCKDIKQAHQIALWQIILKYNTALGDFTRWANWRMTRAVLDALNRPERLPQKKSAKHVSLQDVPSISDTLVYDDEDIEDTRVIMTRIRVKKILERKSGTPYNIYIEKLRNPYVSQREIGNILNLDESTISINMGHIKEVITKTYCQIDKELRLLRL